MQENRSVNLGRIYGLDGLRTLAAAMVFVYHAWGYAGFPSLTLNWGGWQFDFKHFVEFGAEGVTLFFVLSGFLLSLPFWQSANQHVLPNLRTYFLRRFFRIYPTYVVAVIVYVLFKDTLHTWVIRSIHMISHLMLIHNFAEATVFNPAPHLWSVATECQLYAVLPILFWMTGGAFKKLPQLRPMFIFVLSGVLGFVYVAFIGRILTWMPDLDPRLVRLDGVVMSTSVWVGLADFGAGVTAGYVYSLLRSIGGSRKIWSRIAMLSFGALVFLALDADMNVGWGMAQWPGLSFLFAVLVLSVALGNEKKMGLTRCLEFAPVRWLGSISYSFYLFHDFVLWLAFYVLADLWSGWLKNPFLWISLIAYGGTALVSWATYHWIEKTFIRIGRRAEEGAKQ